MFEISRSSLQKACWPNERDVAADAHPSYNEKIVALESHNINHPVFIEKVGALKLQLTQKSKLIDQGHIPKWMNFIQKVHVSPGEYNHTELLSGVELKLRKRYRREKPYFYPFINIALHLISTIDTKYSKLFDKACIADVYEDVADQYIDRLEEAARYVLHIQYSHSKVTYAEWCSDFDKAEWSNSPWSKVLSEYPVLIRWLDTISQNTIDATLELFERLEDDRQDLNAMLELDSLDFLVKLRIGLSDPHKKGRTVACLTFASGKNIIYKPKPVTIDHMFNEFLANRRGEFGIRSIKSLAKEGYGWLEHIDHQEQAPLPAFDDLGKAAANFWLLNTTDLHAENIAVTQDGVYALDLETLLTPQSKSASKNPDPIWRNHNIFSTLLFGFSFGTDSSDHISGFLQGLELDNIGPSIEFTIANDEVIMSTNAPKEPKSNTDSVTNYSLADLEKINTAFRTYFEGDNQLYLESFLENLNNSHVIRQVFRDTHFYARILERMRQPQFLRDAGLMYLDLMSLYLGLLNTSDDEKDIYELVEEEISQLIDGDVPYFYTYSNQLNLHLGDKVIKNFFEKTGIDTALRKIKKFEESDLKEQQSLISLSVGRNLKHSYKYGKAGNLSEEIMSFLSEHLSFLCESAFCPSASPARWVSITGDISGTEGKAIIGQRDFFSGSWGILFTIEAISQSIGSNHHQAFLEEQAQQWKAWYTEYLGSGRDPNILWGYSGIGGTLFAQANLLKANYKRWSFLESFIFKQLTLTQDKIENDKGLDIISGAAGLVLGIEQLLGSARAPALIELLKNVQILAAEHLISRAKTGRNGIYWTTPEELKPLLAYAHGWPGFVVALKSVLNRLDQRSKKYTLIQGALSESLSFVVNQYNENSGWFDYRARLPNGTPLNNSWCNGTPGLIRGLAALQAILPEHIEDSKETLINDVYASLKHQGEYRFCCGQMGVIDLILDLQRTDYKFEDGHDRNATEDVMESALKVIGDDSYDMVPELSFPSLFQGTSGIAYVIARYIDPSLPSLSGQEL